MSYQKIVGLLLLVIILSGCSLFGIGGDVDADPTPDIISATAASSEPGSSDADPEIDAVDDAPDNNGEGDIVESNESAGDSDMPSTIKKSDFEIDNTLSFSFDEVPTLADLIELYPQIGSLMQKQDFTDPDAASLLYEQMVAIYQGEGVEGLTVFLKDSGLSEQLGLDSGYIDYLMAYEEEGPEAAEALARTRNLIDADDQFRLLIVLEDGDLASIQPLLDENNIVVIAQFEDQVEVGIPLVQLTAAQSSEAIMMQLLTITQHENVSGVRVPPSGSTNQLSGEIGEGVIVTGADQWHDAGITGEGVRVAIVDGGFGGFFDLIGTELPDDDNLFIYDKNNPRVLNTLTNPHGSATAEIVHDMAPGAQLFLVNPRSLLDYDEMMNWLVAQDIDIVSHSVGYPMEPIDGTGFLDNMINQHHEDFLWINSAGNAAESHLDMLFEDSDENGIHEFPDGDELLAIRPLGAGVISLILQWEGEGSYIQGREDHDYDIYLMRESEDGDDLEIAASSLDRQAGYKRDQPYEILDFEVTDPEIFYVAIKNAGAETNKRMNLFGNQVEFIYSMPEGSISSPADAEHALAVGATYWEDDALEPYSSQGPTWDGRTKPDLTAPAQVESVTYGQPFPGTSASAPHVAGMAALLLSVEPDLSPVELRERLLENAVDLGDSGMDNEFGAGRIILDEPAGADSSNNNDGDGDDSGGGSAPIVSPSDDEPDESNDFDDNTGSTMSDEELENLVTFDMPDGYEMPESGVDDEEVSHRMVSDSALIVLNYGLSDGVSVADNRDGFTESLEDEGFVLGGWSSLTVNGQDGFESEVTVDSDGTELKGKSVIFGSDEVTVVVLGLSDGISWVFSDEDQFDDFIDTIEINDTTQTVVGGGYGGNDDPEPTDEPDATDTPEPEPTDEPDATDTPEPEPTSKSNSAAASTPLTYEADGIVSSAEVGLTFYIPEQFVQELVEKDDRLHLVVKPDENEDDNLVLIDGSTVEDDSESAVSDQFEAFEAQLKADGVTGLSISDPTETKIGFLYDGVEADFSGLLDDELISGRVAVFSNGDGQVATLYLLMGRDIWSSTGESLYDDMTIIVILTPATG